MNGTKVKGMVLRIMIGALLPLVGMVPVRAQDKKPTQAERNKAAQDKAAEQQKRQQEHKAQRQAEARQKHKEQQEQEQQRKAARLQEARGKNGQQDARVVAAPQPAPPPKPAMPRATRGPGERLPQARQEQLIAQQRDRGSRYREDLVRRERAGLDRAQALRQDSRMAQYRFQEDYLQRLRHQRVTLESRRSYDYAGDPYFYTPPSVRYARQGTYYETNQYGVDLLRSAVDHGYQEGIRTGEADLLDNWDDGYEDSYAFRDANFGYVGEYVDQSEYNYYFREGFRRGYDDGYNRRYRYGRQANGRFELIPSALAQILTFHSLN